MVDFYRFQNFNPKWAPNFVRYAVENAEVYSGEKAAEHFFRVASSIDSMVVGEREIITQVRTAYESCNELKLTGDNIRLLLRKTIETAKEVYTSTGIANKPVSVVSLAYRKLQALNVSQGARFIIVGAGRTNANMTRFLKKRKRTRKKRQHRLIG